MTSLNDSYVESVDLTLTPFHSVMTSLCMFKMDVLKSRRALEHGHRCGAEGGPFLPGFVSMVNEVLPAHDSIARKDSRM